MRPLDFGMRVMFLRCSITASNRLMCSHEEICVQFLRNQKLMEETISNRSCLSDSEEEVQKTTDERWNNIFEPLIFESSKQRRISACLGEETLF